MGTDRLQLRLRSPFDSALTQVNTAVEEVK